MGLLRNPEGFAPAPKHNQEDEMIRSTIGILVCLSAAVLALGGCDTAGSSGTDFGKDPALGTLTIGLGTAHGSTLTDRSVPVGVTNDVVMAQISLAVDDTEDIRIDSLVLTASGSGNDVTELEAATGVRLYVDVNGDGLLDAGDTMIQELAYTIDNGNAVFTLTRTIGKGTTENLLVVYDFDTSTVNQIGGSTFTFSVEPSTDVTAVALTSGGSPLISGSQFNGIMATVTGSVTLGKGPYFPPSFNVSSHASGLTVLQLDIGVDAAEDVSLTSLTINAVDASPSQDLAEDTAVISATLWADVDGSGTLTGGDVGLGTSQSYAQNNGSVTFTGFTRTISRSTSEYWIVVYNIDVATGGDNFSVRLDQDTDLSGSGVLSARTPFISGAPIPGDVFTTVQTGILTVRAGSGNPNSNTLVEEGASGQTVLEVELAADSYENITVNSISFSHTGTGVISGGSPNDVILFELYNVTGGATISLAATVSGTRISFNSITETITAGASERWQVRYTMSSGLTGSGGHNFQLSFASPADVSATGSLSSPIGISGRLGSPLPTGFAYALTLVEGLTLSQGAQHPGNGSIGPPGTAVSRVMAQIRFDATCDAVNLNGLTLYPRHTTGGNEATDITAVTFYEDSQTGGTLGTVDTGIDTQLATGTFPGGGLQQSFSFSSSQTVTPGTPLYILVEFTFGTTGQPGDDYYFTIDNNSDVSAQGVGSGLSPVLHGLPFTSAILNYGASLGVTLGQAPMPNSNVDRTSGTDHLMATFVLSETTNLDDIDVTSITFTAVGGIDQSSFLTSHVDNVYLYLDTDPAGNPDGQYTSGMETLLGSSLTPYTGGNTITFTFAAVRVAQNGSQNFFVVYDFFGDQIGGPWVGASYAVEINSPTDITAVCVSGGGTPTASNLPLRSPIQAIQGIWSTALTTDNTQWPATYQTYGVYQHSMAFNPGGGTAGWGSLVTTGGQSYDWITPATGPNIHRMVLELDLGANGGGLTDYQGTGNYAWVAHTYTGTPPGGMQAGSPPTYGFHSDGSMAWFANGGNDYFLYYGGQIVAPGSTTIALANQGTFTYDIATQAWNTRVTASGGAPSGLGRFRNAWGIDRTGTWPVFYVWGGSNGTARLNDVYTLTLGSLTTGSWNQIQNIGGTTPAGRFWCAGAVDTVTGTTTRFLVSGGEDPSASVPLFQDGAYLSTGANPAYTNLANLNMHRTQMAFAWDPDGKQLLMYGGLIPNTSGPGYVGCSDLESHQMGAPSSGGTPSICQWLSQVGAPGAPLGVGTGRGRMPAVWDSLHHRFILFGGTNMTFNATAPHPNERADLGIYICR
jgi:hypothetical protein